MTERTIPLGSQNNAAARRVGPIRASGLLMRIGAFVILLAAMFFGVFASEAHGHGVHTGLSVQMPPTVAEGARSQSEAEAERTPESAEAGCGANCCSATGCAAAVLDASYPRIAEVAEDSRFALPGHPPTKPSPKDSLKRPPRA